MSELIVLILLIDIRTFVDFRFDTQCIFEESLLLGKVW